MDLLFAASTPWSWDAEKTFAILKQDLEDSRGMNKVSGLDVEAEAKGVE
jgi:hypothetical protein